MTTRTILFVLLFCLGFIHSSSAQKPFKVKTTVKNLLDKKLFDEAFELSKHAIKNHTPSQSLELAFLFFLGSKHELEEVLYYTIRPYLETTEDSLSYFNQLSTCIRYQYRYTDAILCQDSILSIKAPIIDDSERANIFFTKALNYSDLGLITRSNEYALHSLKLSEQQNLTALLGEVYLLLGFNFGELKDYSTAINYLDLSLKSTDDSTNIRKLIFDYLNLGDLYQKINVFEQARTYFYLSLEKAIAYKQPEFIILAYRFLSANASLMRESENSIAFLDTARAIAKENQLKNILVEIEQTSIFNYLDNNLNEELGKVIAFLDSINVNHIPDWRVPVEVRIRWLINTGKEQEAITFLDTNTTDSPFKISELDRQMSYATAYSKLGNKTKTRFHFNSIFDLYKNKVANAQLGNDYSKALYSSRTAKTIRSISEPILKVIDDPEFSFAFHELVKGNIIAEKIKQLQHSNSFSIPDSIQFKLFALKEQIALIKAKNNPKNSLELSNKQRALEQLESENQLKTSPSTNTKDSETITLKQVQDNLSTDDVFIHFLETANGYHCLYISKTETKSRFIVGKENAIQLMSSFSESVRNPLSNSVDSLSSILFAQFAGEHATWLVSHKNWLLSLDGHWLSIPIDALSFQQKYIAENHTIRWVPSATVAFNLNQLKRWYFSNTMLLTSNPTYPKSSSWSALPFTEIEANYIQKLPFSIQSYSKEENTPVNLVAAFKRSTYRYIHIASHGVTDISPDQNRLILSYKDDETKGLFYPHHLEFGHLESDLVVLSSCESAYGKFITGDGIWGMQRAWMVSGAESVLASLWKVNDQSTALFMNYFYTKLSDKNGLSSQVFERFNSSLTSSSKANAVQEAKLELIKSKKYAHPYYWAAFHYSGL